MSSDAPRRSGRARGGGRDAAANAERYRERVAAMEALEDAADAAEAAGRPPPRAVQPPRQRRAPKDKGPLVPMEEVVQVLEPTADGGRFVYLECNDGEHLKFYHLEVPGDRPSSLRLEWGRIGEWTRDKTWDHGSPEECMANLQHRYSERLHNGYKRVRGGRVFGFGAKLLSQAAVNRERNAAAAARLVDSKPVREWDAGDVAAWVRTFGAEYETAAGRMAEAGVGGRVLLRLDDAALAGDLGVDSRVHRIKLTSEIQALQELTFGAVAGAAGAGDDAGAEPALVLPPEVARIDPSELDIRRVLGQGSFGVAELASWRGSEVVVKRLHDLSPSVVEELRREAQLLARVSRHPHIISFVGVCEEPESLCLVSEYAPNGSVEDALVHRRMFTGAEHFAKVTQIAADVAAALLHMHSEADPVVHRDIAARNVLLDASFRGKLADFGMSRLIKVEEKAAGRAAAADDVPSAVAAGQTKSNVGPLKWMAPESLRERRYSPASDVYMFGVFLWELFARMEPYADTKAPSLVQVASDVMRGELRPTRLTHDVCPFAVSELMERCWAQEPGDRVSTKELHASLCAAVEQLSAGDGGGGDSAPHVPVPAYAAAKYGVYFEPGKEE